MRRTGTAGSGGPRTLKPIGQGQRESDRVSESVKDEVQDHLQILESNCHEIGQAPRPPKSTKPYVLEP